VRTAVESVEEQARAANLSVEWEGPDDSFSAMIDHDGLHDIVHHLLNNAIKFTEDGDTITVRLRETDDMIVLVVADTGIGMDPGRVPELLKPFRQASTGLDRSHEGCGVGLAVVQRWVGAMSGTVDVETAKGEGTTVTVRLPRAPTLSRTD
jgi:signal transduction histidine kinase